MHGAHILPDADIKGSDTLCRHPMSSVLPTVNWPQLYQGHEHTADIQPRCCAAPCRFASQLVQSLAMAGQEVPQQLYELAQQDSRFRQGSSRHKGGRGGGRRKGQVGGAGLGFSSGPPAVPGMPSSTAGGLPGFARAASGDGPSAGVPAAGGSRPMAGFAAASTPAAPAAPSGPLPPPPPGPVPASATGPPPPPQQQAASSSGRSDGLDLVKSVHMQRFSKSFVSAGATQGDIGQVATVVMPKVRSWPAAHKCPG